MTKEQRIQECRNIIQDCTDSIRRIEKLEDTTSNQKRIYDLRKERESFRLMICKIENEM